MHSLIKILQSLIAVGNKNAKEQMDETEDSRKETTSIRLKPQTRAYLQAQSEILGVSVSQLINIMVDGVVSLETTPQKNQIDSIYDRLIMLFESHGITPLDMSRMLKKYGVTLSKLKSRDTMLDLITPELLTEVSEWFGINPSWLGAQGNDIYSRNKISWYKHTEGMALSLIERRIDYHDLRIYVIKKAGISFSTAENSDDNNNCMEMGFLLKYRHNVGDVSFDKYEFCEFQRWNYDKCRQDLKIIFKFISELEKRCTGVHLYGISLSDNLIEKIYNGSVFPSQIEKDFFRHGVWYPEDHIDDILADYNKKDFQKFIDAYCGNPSKIFSSEYDKYNSKKWKVRVWGDKPETHEYLYLWEALEKIHDKYHKKIDSTE